MISCVISKHILPTRKNSDLCTSSSLPAFVSLCHFYTLHSHMTCAIQRDVFSASPLTKYTPGRGWIFKILSTQLSFHLNTAYPGNFNCSVAVLMISAYVYILFSCFDTICYICDLKLTTCPNLSRRILTKALFGVFLIYYTIFKQQFCSFLIGSKALAPFLLFFGVAVVHMGTKGKNPNCHSFLSYPYFHFLLRS